MVTINNICIDGYKNIHELNVNLSKRNVFLSANNYGKSNVLSAIIFGFDFITKPSKVKSNMMKWKPGFPFNTVDFGKNFKFDIEFEFGSDEIKYVKYGFEFAWQKSSKELGKVVSECLKIKQPDSQKYSTYIERCEEYSRYKTASTGRCDKDVIIKDNELIVNKISNFDDLFYLDVIEAINNLTIFVDRHFDANELFNEIPVIQKQADITSPYNDESIARTLYYLKKEHKNRYQLIINTLIDFFPYITEVIIREINLSEKKIKVEIDENAPFEVADYVYILYVKNKYMSNIVPFDVMSDGVKRLLSLLTYMTLADIKGIPIIGIEEPENSIHPGLLRKYLDVIDGFIDSSRIIITSHSPYLINYMNLSELHIGELRDDGRAVFKTISKNGITRINNYAEEMGVQTGEYLFSVVSGVDEFDAELLKKCLENE